MSDVFISYSRRDKEFVHILHDALEKSEKKTWVDWEDILPTSEWWQEIENAIAGSDTFIFVISPASIASEYCNKEVEYAFNLHKRILPIVRQDVTDITQVQVALSRHQWIFFRESDDFDISFQKLLEAIALDLPYIHAHTKLLVRAIEWDNKQRKDGFLLRGEDLEEAEKWLADSVAKLPKATELQRTYIENSRKVEDANHRGTQILQAAVKKAEKQKQIGLVTLLITVLFGVVISLWLEVRYQRREEDLKSIYQLKEVEQEKKYQSLLAQYDRTNKKLEQDITFTSSEFEKNVTETNIKNTQLLNTSVEQDKQAIVYVHVPSENTKTTIKNLPTKLQEGNYKTNKIVIVGSFISPERSQIRYFFDNPPTKNRAIKLQQKLKELGYKDFKSVFVRGFEKKTKPEMLEIWFAKDAK